MVLCHKFRPSASGSESLLTCQETCKSCYNHDGFQSLYKRLTYPDFMTGKVTCSWSFCTHVTWDSVWDTVRTHVAIYIYMWLGWMKGSHDACIMGDATCPNALSPALSPWWSGCLVDEIAQKQQLLSCQFGFTLVISPFHEAGRTSLVTFFWWMDAETLLASETRLFDMNALCQSLLAQLCRCKSLHGGGRILAGRTRTVFCPWEGRSLGHHGKSRPFVMK